MIIMKKEEERGSEENIETSRLISLQDINLEIRSH